MIIIAKGARQFKAAEAVPLICIKAKYVSRKFNVLIRCVLISKGNGLTFSKGISFNLMYTSIAMKENNIFRKMRNKGWKYS